jgi:glycosyltransferase involved in cell wall biosynthesis
MGSPPPEFSAVIPVYNEAESIRGTIAELDAKVPVSKEAIIVYDVDEDTTVPVARELMATRPWIRLVKNRHGRGALAAIRTGLESIESEAAIVVMADQADDLSAVKAMLELRRHGYDMVCGSRYMKGGRQIGGPRLKSFLSRMAGLSLKWVAGLPVHDATNSFKLYSRRLLQAVSIESDGGFEIGIELVVKAHFAGFKVGEVPSVWKDRTTGKSRFRLVRWLPKYLRWYLLAIWLSTRQRLWGSPPRRWALATVAIAAGLAFVYRAAFGGLALGARDIYRLYLPDSTFLRASLMHGHLPLWNPYLRLGQPFLANVWSEVLYPFRVLPVILAGPVWGLTFEHFAHVVIACVGTALAAKRLGASRITASVSGAAYGFGLLLTHLASESNMVASAAWAGFILAASIDLGRRPSARAVAWLAAASAMSFLAGGPEEFLWECLIALPAAIWVSRRRMAALIAFAGAMTLCGVLCAGAALPAWELTRNSMQAATLPDQFVWSASPADVLSMIWPGFDWPLADYWKDQSLVLGLFQGTAVAAGAAMAVFGRAARRRTAALIAVAAVLCFLSLGQHFTPSAWVEGHFPFRHMRYPSKYLIGVGFLITVLAGVGLRRIGALARRVPRSRGIAVAGLVGAMALGAIGIPGVRLLGARAGAGPGLAWTLLILASAASIFALLPGSPMERARRVTAGLAVLALGELASMHALGGAQNSWMSAAALAAPSRLGALIDRKQRASIGADLYEENLDEKDPDRIVELSRRYVENARNALIPNTFEEEEILTPDGEGPPTPLRLDELAGEGSRGFFDLVGVGWYVRRGPAPFPDLEAVSTTTPKDGILDLPNLYRSRTALPRTFVVTSLRNASDDDAKAAIHDPSQPFRTTAYLSLLPGVETPRASGCEGSKASIVSEGPNSLLVDVEACGDGVLVIADSWFPGWQATLDRVAVPVFRADYLLRAVPIRAGHHQVELRYRPLLVVVGAGLSALGLLIWIWLMRRASSNVFCDRRHRITNIIGVFGRIIGHLSSSR